MFNPKQAGTMKIVAETQNAEYFELRAVEEIRRANAMRNDRGNVSVALYSDYHIKINRAIQLLALARIEEL